MIMAEERIQIDRNKEELNISIRAFSDPSKTNLLLLWLVAFTACGIIVFLEFFKPQPGDMKIYLFVFMAFWAYFEFRILKAYRWRKYGRELIKIKGERLTLVRETAGRGVEHVYNTTMVRNFRRAAKKEGFAEAMSTSYWIIAGETLSFDHMGKEVYFGLQLEEKDIAAVFKAIRSFLPKAED